ncbi:Adenylate cyclase [hydrothermal vent metagenome]|uniref:Adenylate cyclase n=1 Tax=hydrothermal vent metagenome TaxID=652676 RepID=A0A3B1DKM5_9ZZZZ
MMFELLIVGPHSAQRLRYPLATETRYLLGRGTDADLPVPWDLYLSKKHASLNVVEGKVEVTLLDSATNPLFSSGQPVEHLSLRDGDYFVIGSTTFYLSATKIQFGSTSLEPIQEVTFGQKELKDIRIHDADRRIDVLASLSEIISEARGDEELHFRLVNLLLTGVPHAEAVAIVSFDEEETADILQWGRRRETAGKFYPSSKLVKEALFNKQKSVLHTWGSKEQGKSDYTEANDFDWAYCTPIHDNSKKKWGIYVAGTLKLPFVGGKLSDGGRSDLHADVKFTEIVAELISSVQKSNQWERQRSGMKQFFAPPILDAIGEDINSALLEPRECNVTILFCDLRGFSKQSEQSEDDLLGLLDRVSSALGIMQRQILKHGGVTGDFLGDATLGFWGWPIESDNSPLDACRAALDIHAAFKKMHNQKNHPLANFQLGIGIANGIAVAGKIGTSERVTFTVFGPVVNLASRLESMTKQLRVPIVLDEQTANIVRERLHQSEGRIRKLANVLPYGMEKSVLVNELLPPVSDYPEFTDAHCKIYEAGVEDFIAGRWEEAYQRLHQMPANDRAQDFLSVLIAQHNRIAPPDWDGIIRLPRK